MIRPVLLLRTVRHYRLGQLYHRLRLTAFRRTRSALLSVRQVEVFPSRLNRRRVVPRLRNEVPMPLFPPRTHGVTSSGNKCTGVDLAGTEIRLTPPLPWHRQDLKRGTRLELLNLHYMEYLEAVDDTTFKLLIRDWIENNRTQRPDYWRDAWNSYALSIRVVVWMQEYARRTELDSDTRTLMVKSVYDQLEFLSRNVEYDVGGNHIVRNIRALLWAGCFFAEEAARRWHSIGRELLEKQLKEQILDDGMHYERSPAYHAQVCSDLLECVYVLDGYEVSGLNDRLTRMLDALADVTHPDGAVSLFNDGGLNMSRSPQSIQRVARDLLGFTACKRRCITLPSAGYYGYRTEREFFLTDCGRIGPDHFPAHAHGDILAFEWSLDGYRIVVDAGVSEYHPGSWREYSRSTRAHNTVALEEHDQCEFWKSFRVGRRANVICHLYECNRLRFRMDGEHDGYTRLEGKPVHRRFIRSSGSRLVIRDKISAGAGQQAVARVMFHPECEVISDGRAISITRREVNVTLMTSYPFSLETGWWMPDFGRRVSTTVLAIRYGRSPCKGGFVIQK